MSSFKSLFKSLLIFLFLASLITFSWYRTGLLYGGAEVGIFGYNPNRLLDFQQFIWWGAVAPGMLVPQFVVGVPLYFVLTILQLVFSPLILQLVISFVLLFMMGYGMYIFSLSVIGKEKNRYALIAAFFYMFNSYTMVEIWHRFLYTGFFLAAALPLLAFFWKQWTTKGSFISLTFFLLTNLAFVYMFGNLTSMIAIWLLLSMMTLADVIFCWQGKKNLFNLSYRFVIGLILFLLTNLWWLIPVLKVSTGVLPEQHSSEDNISTLVNLSKQTILPFSLQYANPFYLFYTQELGGVYSNFLFRILPWFPAVVIFVGLLASFKRKVLAGFGLAYLLAVFIAKGAASPFGYPYIWGFMNIYLLGIIRNPFEKLGILLPFLGSILFIIGLETIISWGAKKIGSFFSKLVVVSILVSVLIYGWPMFSGKVFNKPDYPLTVQVPDSYKEADNWFKLQKNSDGNILHLPFPDRDVVTYNWDYGYHGVEINEILFTSLPSITRTVGIKRVDDVLKSLSFIFTLPFSEDKNQTLEILQSLNVQYIVLHKDTRWQDVPTYGKYIRLYNPLEIENTLNSLNFLEQSVVYGDLVIYKLKDDFYRPKIVFSDSSSLIYGRETTIMQTLPLTQNSNQVSLTSKDLDETILKNISQLLIFPDNVLQTWEPQKRELEGIINQILINPDSLSPVKQMEDIKQKFFFQTGELLSQTLVDKMILASDSLIDLVRKKDSTDRKLAESILNKYSDLIEEIFNEKFNGSSVERIFKVPIIKVFTLHLYILDSISEGSNTEIKQLASQIRDKLNSYLVNNDVLPAFRLSKQTSETLQRRVHRFSVPAKASYELLMGNLDTLSFYPEVMSKLNVQLDGRSFPLRTAQEGNRLNLGKIELDKGVHEISYELIQSDNLVTPLDKVTYIGTSGADNQIIRLKTTQQSGAAINIPLAGVAGNDTYEINFEALFENPREFYVQVIEDTQDQSNPFDCSRVSCYDLKLNPSTTDWQGFSLSLNPLNLATRKANLQILLPTITSGSPAPSVIQIRNLKVSRIMGNNLILRRNFFNESYIASSSAQLIELNKISPVRYEGKIKLDKPTFMFFKETFNPGWTLQLTEGDKTFKIDKHFLGNLYGNTYYIDKEGKYNFKLEFEPQKNVNTGLTLSILGWTGILMMLLYKRFKGES